MTASWSKGATGNKHAYYDRQRDRLHAQLTLERIDEHKGTLDELDVEGILAFAERVLPRASDLWIQASLEHRECLQKLFSQRGSRSTARPLFERR